MERDAPILNSFQIIIVMELRLGLRHFAPSFRLARCASDRAELSGSGEAILADPPSEEQTRPYGEPKSPGLACSKAPIFARDDPICAGGQEVLRVLWHPAMDQEL
jgi:hypothetical protein